MQAGHIMTQACSEAYLNLIVLSPSFIGKNWPFKELSISVEENNHERLRTDRLVPLFYQVCSETACRGFSLMLPQRL